MVIDLTGKKNTIDLTPPKKDKILGDTFLEKAKTAVFGLGPESNLKEQTVPLGAKGSGILNIIAKGGKTVESWSAVNKAARVGTSVAKAGQVASNAKTSVQTATWITKLVKFAKDPKVVVTGLMAAIGTYPFASFIQEEAIQTTTFPLSQAYREGNEEAYVAAKEAYNEVVDDSLWEGIIAGIPYANLIKRLVDYKKAADASVNVYDLLMSNKIGGVDASGEAIQKEDDFIANTEIYNQKRIDAEIELQSIRASADKARIQRALDYQRNLDKMEAEDRQAIADFWAAYAEEKRKLADDSRPSNLNFGLI